MKPTQYWGKDYYVGKIAEEYLQSRTHEKAWSIEEKIVEEWIQTIPQGESVLDIPVGTGRFLSTYLKARLKIYGVDISLDMLNEAQKVLTEDQNHDMCVLLQGDIEELPFANGAIDRASCIRLFHLLPPSVIENAIFELSRVVSKEIIIQVFSVYEPSFAGVIERTRLALVSQPVLIFKSLSLAIKLILKDVFSKMNLISSKNVNPSKTFQHSEAQLLRFFKKNDLVVSNIVTVDDRDINSYWILFPTRFYFLSKRKII